MVCFTKDSLRIVRQNPIESDQNFSHFLSTSQSNICSLPPFCVNMYFNKDSKAKPTGNLQKLSINSLVNSNQIFCSLPPFVSNYGKGITKELKDNSGRFPLGFYLGILSIIDHNLAPRVGNIIFDWDLSRN